MEANNGKNNLNYKHFSNPLNSLMYILGLIFVYSSVIGLIILSQNLLDVVLPTNVNNLDVNNYGYVNFYDYKQKLSTITNIFSWLLVVFPLFLVTLFLITKTEIKNSTLVKSYTRSAYLFLPLIASVIYFVGYTGYFINLLISYDYVFSFNDLFKYMIVLIILIPVMAYHFITLKRTSNLSELFIKKTNNN